MQVDRAKYDHILLEHARSLGTEILQPHSICGRQIRFFRSKSRKSNRFCWMMDVNFERSTMSMLAAMLPSCDADLVITTHAPNSIAKRRVLELLESYQVSTNLCSNRMLYESRFEAYHSDGYGTLRSMMIGRVWSGYAMLNTTIMCKRPEELYHQAIAMEPQVSKLLIAASCRPGVEATTDWSFVSERAFGKNWFLCGECFGFADPILAAGMTLTHTSAQHCAISIFGTRTCHVRPRLDLPTVPRDTTSSNSTTYSFCGILVFRKWPLLLSRRDCAAIAENSGLKLTPQEAFRWLSHGGIDDVPGQFVLGGLTLAGIKSVQRRFAHDTEEDVDFCVNNKNVFRLNLAGATTSTMAVIEDGRIRQVALLQRGRRKTTGMGSLRSGSPCPSEGFEG